MTDNTATAAYLAKCRALIGTRYVLTDEAAMEPFLLDWRRRKLF